MKYFCWEIHRELFFLDIKMTISETSTEKLRKFVFLTVFEKGQILRKIWICLSKCFWSNQKKRIIINKNSFSPQSRPHTAKLCLSVVLKHFWRNSQKTVLFRHKSDYLRNEHWNSQKVCFSYHVWIGAKPVRKIWKLFKQIFLIKSVKSA